MAGAGVYIWGNFASEAKTLSGSVFRCGSADPTVRFSCYRAALERYYPEEKTIDGYIRDIENERFIFNKGEDKSYAVFGTNCHTFYHALGDFVGSHTDNDIINYLRSGLTKCTSGYMMGLYKRTALKQGFSDEILSRLYEACRPDERKSCAHEIGHLLHDKYTVSILKTLDDVSLRNFGFEYPRSYSYKTFSQSNLEAPFDECRRLLPKTKQVFCYTGVGHNLFLFSEFSPRGYVTQLEECSTIASLESRNQCIAFLLFRIGINEAAPRFLSSQFLDGIKVCKESAEESKLEDAKVHCYRGVGGGMGLFLESEYPEEDITEEIIPYINKVIEEYIFFCEQSEQEFISDCFRGLLGTNFRGLYNALDISHEGIEKLFPELRSIDDVVG